jgi:hypothetical protein
LECRCIQDLAGHPIDLPIAHVLVGFFEVEGRVVADFSLESLAAVLKDIAIFERSKVFMACVPLAPKHFLAINGAN